MSNELKRPKGAALVNVVVNAPLPQRKGAPTPSGPRRIGEVAKGILEDVKRKMEERNGRK